MILDETPELWTGDRQAIADAAGRWIHDPRDGTIACPASVLFGRVSVILVHGILTSDGWKQLVKEIELAMIEPESRFLLLALDCRAQVWSGCSEAFQAIREARKFVTTCAFIRQAHGLAVNLAINCQVIFASGTSELGHLRGLWPFGRPTDYPDLEATNENLANELRRSEHGIHESAIELLANGVIDGNKSESLGLTHFKSPMFNHACDYLNKIGAAK